MTSKRKTALFILYLVGAVLIFLLLLAIWLWPPVGFGGDWDAALVMAAYGLFLVAGVVECRAKRTQRTAFQKLFVWGPLALFGAFLLVGTAIMLMGG